MDDEKIIALFFQRSELAIEQAREKYGPLCARVAGNMLSEAEDVEECVNDTFLALWNTIPPEEPQFLGAYAAKITRNLARNRLARNVAQKRGEGMRVSMEELGACLVSPVDVEQQVMAKEMARSIETFLYSLDGESRNIFLRRYWFFDTVEQIAAGLGIGRSKVKMRLLRTRAKLREHLIKEGYLDES